jgi:membrane protein
LRVSVRDSVRVLTKVRYAQAAAVARVRSWPIGAAALDAEAGYLRHATSQLAAAISYRMLFSLVPLFALLVSVVSLVAPDEQRNRIASWLADMIPGTDLEESVRRAVADAGTPATAAGLVALVTLLWAASGMMAAIRIAFRVIFENDVQRPYVRAKLLDFVLVAGTGILAVAAFGLAVAVQVLAELGRDLSELVGAGTGGHLLAVTAELMASLAVTFAVFLLLYRSVPSETPRFGALWPPALIGAAAFQVATAGYAYYLARWGNVTSLYGPLGATLGFLLVVYVGVLVLLIGAELVAAWPRHDAVER